MSSYVLSSYAERFFELNRGTVWWPCGVACALVYLLGWRALPGVFAGEWFVASYEFSCPALMGACTGLGNTLECLLGAVVLHKLGFTCEMRPVDLWSLVAASLVAPIAMVICQVPACYYFGWWTDNSMLYLVASFYLNDAIALLYMVPFVLVLVNVASLWQTLRPQLIEFICLLSLISIMTSIAFGLSTAVMSGAVASGIFPFLAWAAIRFRAVVLPIVLMHVAFVIAACVAFQLDPFPKNMATTFPFVHTLLIIHWFSAYGIALAITFKDGAETSSITEAVVKWSHRYAKGIASIVRNQMSVVLGAAELCELRKGLPGPMIISMHSSVNRLCNLSDQLLACGGQAIFPVELDKLEFSEILVAVVSEFAPQARIDGEIPNVRIICNRGLIRIALRNVLLNAKEAGSETVYIRCCIRSNNETAFTRGCRRMNHVDVIEIEDKGCGIADDVKRHIFEPFFSTKSPDRGLGLTAVQGIMHSASGSVSIDSMLGKGTTVKLVFPRM